MLAGFIAFIRSLAIALGWLKEAHDQQIGVDLQAGADAKAAAKAEADMAQAANDAPDTKADVIAALDQGKF